MKDISGKLAEIFKALSDATRLRVIRMLASNAEKTLCVADIAEKLGVSRPAVSQHIKVLKSIGLLEDNREGFKIYYTINLDVMKEQKFLIDDMYNKAFTKCTKTVSCKECSEKKKCQ